MANRRTGSVSKLNILKLWTVAGGRCEYDGCNVPLYRDNLTSSEMNNAYVAHIVAASPDGPRGDCDRSQQLVDNLDNLMLMCPTHHKLIDHDALEDHPEERLLAMKKKHENRIRMLTEIQESKVTLPIIYAANIGRQDCAISKNDVVKALVPNNYPLSDPIEITLTNSLAYDSEKLFWEIESNQIDRAIDKALRRLRETDQVESLSVFALAPQPLLVRLGARLGDLHNVKVYQKHREPDTWQWQEEEEENDFLVKEPEDKSKPPVLVFALSAKAIESRVRSRYGDDASIWVITADNPHNDMLMSSNQLSRFRRLVRKVLDEINTSVLYEEIKVFMAMPVACAVELGRVWMPKADKRMVLYDKNNVLANEDIETITIR